MKKYLSILILIIFIFTLSSCSNKPKMSKRVELMIKKAYTAEVICGSEYYRTDYTGTRISLYIGKRHKAHLAIIRDDLYSSELGKLYLWFDYPSDFYIVSVDGYGYPFLRKYPVSVYYKGKYFNLQNAYNEGILSSKDIDWLYDYCNENIFIYQLYYKSFDPEDYKDYVGNSEIMDGLTFK